MTRDVLPGLEARREDAVDSRCADHLAHVVVVGGLLPGLIRPGVNSSDHFGSTGLDTYW